jgi:hypothetical protein
MNADEYIKFKSEAGRFEDDVKRVVLTLNKENPSTYNLDSLKVGYYGGDFMVANPENHKSWHASKEEVEAAIAQLPKLAVVTHTPESGDDIKVGDIYYCSWGYSMTCIDYFKVVKRTAHFATLRKLNKQNKGANAFVGTSLPLDTFEDYHNVYDDERFVDTDGKVYAQRTVKIGSTAVLNYKKFMVCYPWDGREHRYDHLD